MTAATAEDVIQAIEQAAQLGKTRTALDEETIALDKNTEALKRNRDARSSSRKKKDFFGPGFPSVASRTQTQTPYGG